MAKNKLDDLETQLAVCKMRYEGATNQQIIDELNISAGDLCAFIDTFPRYREARPEKPTVDVNTAIKVCELCLAGEKRKIISKKTGVSTKEIANIIDYIAHRKHRRISAEEKADIIRDRLRYRSVGEIAEKTGRSKQNISAFLKSLPHVDIENAKAPDIDPDVAYDVLVEYFAGSTLGEAAAHYGVALRAMNEVIDFAVARKAKRADSRYFPAITEWMLREGYNMRTFSELVGFSSATLGALLTGKRLMSVKYADRICNVTGLTYTEVFSVQLQGAGINPETYFAKTALTAEDIILDAAQAKARQPYNKPPCKRGKKEGAVGE